MLTTSPALVRRNLELQIQWERTISSALEGVVGAHDAAVLAAASVACAHVVVARALEASEALDTVTMLAAAFAALRPLVNQVASPHPVREGSAA